MRRIIYSLVFVSSLFFIACGDDSENLNESNSDSVIIGIYFGECIGDCATMYELRGDDIYPDIIENGYSQEPEFSGDPLSVSEDLLKRFQAIESDTPDFIFDSSETSFGCPDCGDWGAIHYQIGDQSWTLDNMVENNPDEIQGFVRTIQTLLEDLR